MRVFVLTSSRADYGIYLPLLKKLSEDSYFELKLVVFGTHLAASHGMTVDQILRDGFTVNHRLETMPTGDSPVEVAAAMGRTTERFANLWGSIKDSCDLVFALGDRYEMFAAVAATVPFNLKVAHLHGGETTLGAIDEAFRHSITAMSSFHFVSTQKHADRVTAIKGSAEGVFNVGALSLDNLRTLTIPSQEEFAARFGFKLSEPVLFTFHPETVHPEKSAAQIDEIIAALCTIKGQIVITLPNADPGSMNVRNALLKFAASHDNVQAVESLGTAGYFACMKACRFVMGNSSSGIIEAASFGKYVINLGVRQQGRDAGKNVLHCAITAEAIKTLMQKMPLMPELDSRNIYGDGNAADKIISHLRTSTL